MEDRILTYLGRRPATPEHLERSLEVDAADLREVVDKMEATGWVTVMPAWFGNDPGSAITVISLTRAGRQEAERRQALAEERDEPVIVSREELAAELRRLGWTDEQIALNPNLRGNRFHYWPSVPAWSVVQNRH